MAFEIAYRLDGVLEEGTQEFVTDETLDHIRDSPRYAVLYFRRSTDRKLKDYAPLPSAFGDDRRVDGPFKTRPTVKNRNTPSECHLEEVLVRVVPLERLLEDSFEDVSRTEFTLSYREWEAKYLDTKKLQEGLNALVQKLTSMSSTPDLDAKRFLSIGTAKVEISHSDRLPPQYPGGTNSVEHVFSIRILDRPMPEINTLDINELYGALSSIRKESGPLSVLSASREIGKRYLLKGDDDPIFVF
jgi:hypothetical protein